MEIDLVAYQRTKDRYLVAECKWKTLTEKQEATLLCELEENFQKTKLRKKLTAVEFRIFTPKDLQALVEISA